jgi:hypothetical protein
MARPSDVDTDPGAPKIVFEVVVTIVPDVPFPSAASPQIAARVQARTGVAPTSVTIDAAGTATVVLPDTGADPGFWVAWVAGAMAAFTRPGVVTLVAQRARVLP